MMKQPFFRKALQYFFNGVLILVPAAVTLYILYKLFVFLDDLLPFEKEIPGLGLVALIITLTLIGFLGTTLIARPLNNWFNSLLERAPLIKTMYDAVNDLVGAFVGKKRRFTKPVLVKVDQHLDLERIGYVTDEDLAELGSKAGKVAVYIPHSYAFSGNLWIVPREHLTPIDSSTAADVMKYIISGGISDIDSKEKE
jgi:uncharacterized membrane protein